jgi:OTU domain-containing protein 6
MQLNYKDLRERTAAYMRNHPDEFAPFLQDKSGESRSLEAYTTEIQETARWGGEMEISAVARSFSVSVRVIRAEGGDLAYEAQHGTELVLARYEHMYSLGAHFNSMRPAGENARVA